MPADDFDAILEPSPGAAASGSAAALSAPSSSGTVAPGVHEATVEGPRAATLQDFAAHWDLYRDPVLAGVLAGAALAALGVFVLLRRAVFFTAALSQAAGLGVALAFFCEIHLGFGLPPAFGALGAAAIVTGVLGGRAPRRVAREAIVGFVFVAASALAVLVGDAIAQEAHDLTAILFGTAVLVRPRDLWLLAAGAVVTSVGLAAFGRALVFTGLDPDGARVQGLPVRAIEIAFWASFALEVSLATRALGSLPVFAFAVLPPAAGLLLANRVQTALAIAVGAGVVSGGAGYLVAFVGELPVGACQAATATALTVLAFAVARVSAR